MKTNGFLLKYPDGKSEIGGILNDTNKGPLDKLAGTTITDLESVIKVIKTDADPIDYTEKTLTFYSNTTTLSDYEEPTAQSITSDINADIHVFRADHIRKGNFLVIQGVFGYESNGTTVSSSELVLIVNDVNHTTNVVNVKAVNGKKIGNLDLRYVPSIPAGSTVKNLGGKVDDDTIPIPIWEPDNQFKSVGFRTFAVKVPDDYSFSKEQAINYFNYNRDLTYFMQAQDKDGTYFNGLWRSAGKEFVVDDSFDNDDYSHIETNLVQLMGEVSNSIMQSKSNRTKLVLCNTRFLQGIYVATGGTFKMEGFGNKFIFAYSPICDSGVMESIVLDVDDIDIYCKEPKKVITEDENIIITETSTIVMNTPRLHCRILFV